MHFVEGKRSVLGVQMPHSDPHPKKMFMRNQCRNRERDIESVSSASCRWAESESKKWCPNTCTAVLHPSRRGEQWWGRNLNSVIAEIGEKPSTRRHYERKESQNRGLFFLPFSLHVNHLLRKWSPRLPATDVLQSTPSSLPAVPKYWRNLQSLESWFHDLCSMSWIHSRETFKRFAEFDNQQWDSSRLGRRLRMGSSRREFFILVCFGSVKLR